MSFDRNEPIYLVIPDNWKEANLNEWKGISNKSVESQLAYYLNWRLERLLKSYKNITGN
ncbi:hypothetical protein JL09_g7001, partial [Pichia kudriavzevii]